ncbi:hypothetical protein [Candidatus Desulforudis audaxviator]|uniref:hypothetical protein n=1 Tax=Candidatus Desulforudis audaxviator TaxID=471827 RepID=UPI0005A1BE7D|nr:hypothetical protein [Candidatus Desulforudis audaxviator]
MQDSGRSWRRETREEEQGPLHLPAWRPPENRQAWVEVSCLDCGRHIRDAYPPAREKYFACGAVVSVDREAREKREKRCETCKKLFVPEPGKDEPGKEKNKYCSDTCRRMVERDHTRARKQRSRERNRAAG